MTWRTVSSGAILRAVLLMLGCGAPSDGEAPLSTGPGAWGLIGNADIDADGAPDLTLVLRLGAEAGAPDTTAEVYGVVEGYALGTALTLHEGRAVATQDDPPAPPAVTFEAVFVADDLGGIPPLTLKIQYEVVGATAPQYGRDDALEIRVSIEGYPPKSVRVDPVFVGIYDAEGGAHDTGYFAMGGRPVAGVHFTSGDVTPPVGWTP